MELYKINIKNILVLLFVISFSSIWGQTKVTYPIELTVDGGGIYTYSEVSGIALTNTPEIPLSILDIQIPNQKHEIINKEIEFSLYFEPVFQNFQLESSNQFEITLDISLKEYLVSSQFQVLIPIQTIVINPDKPEAKWKFDLTNYQGNLAALAIHINSNTNNFIGSNYISDEMIAYINSHLKLSINYIETVIKDVRDETGSMLTDITTLPVPLVDNKILGRKIPFSWNNTSTSFDNHLIQVLRLHNIDPQATDIESITAEVDWKNALTLETYSGLDQFDCNLTEGEGFYIWRVRPIGNYYDNGIANNLNWGKWTDAPETGETISVSLNGIAGSSDNCWFYMEDPDDDKNWIYKRVFTESNKIHESITYGDNLNYPRQSHTKVSINDKIIVNQSLNDFTGRTTFTTIPVPIDGNMSTGYINELVKTDEAIGTTPVPYTSEHFDTDLYYNNPKKVDENEHFQYYNKALNTDADNIDDNFVPNTKGYPYTRSLKLSNSGGVYEEQSGVGQTHSINTANKHTIRTSYSTPHPDELISIFGKEAPDANKTLKVLTYDANNVVSLKYISDKGKTLATCLVGNPAVELQNLTETQNIFSSKQSINITEKKDSIFSGEQWITITELQDIVVDYSSVTANESVGCTSYSIELETEVTIELYDVNYPDNPIGGIIEINSDNFPQPAHTYKDVFPGVYSLKKKVVVLGDATRISIDLANDAEKYIKPVLDFVDGLMQIVINKAKLREMAVEIYIYNSHVEDVVGGGGMSIVDFCEMYSTFPVEDFVENAGEFPLDAAFHKIIMVGYDHDISTSVPSELWITTCCDGEPIIIPLTIENNTPCPEDEEELIDWDNMPDFEGYFYSVLEEIDIKNGTLNDGDIVLDDFINNAYTPINLYADYATQLRNYKIDPKHFLMPKITKDDGDDGGLVNWMFYHMLTDEYGTNEVQYTCKDLWTCWTATLRSIQNINEFQTPEVNTVYNKVGEQPGQEHTYDNQFDNNFSGGNFLIDWFIGYMISVKMKEEEDGNSNTSSTIDNILAYDLDVIEQFLNCSERKFHYPLGDLDKPLSEDRQSSGDENGDFYNSQRNGGVDVYPNTGIKDPVYAFKYYEYSKGSHIFCERNMAYDGIMYGVSYPNPEGGPDIIFTEGGTDHLICDDYPTSHINKNYKDWDFTESEVFLECIKYDDGAVPKPLTPTQMTCVDAFNTQNTSSSNSIATHIYNSRTNIITDCNENCDNKRNSYVNEIRRVLEENCYQIVNSCEVLANTGATDLITEEDIAAIADKMVGECKGLCPEDIPDNQLQALLCEENTEGCYNWDYNIGGLVFYPTEVNISTLTDCEERMRQMALMWAAEISMSSQCKESVGTVEQWVKETHPPDCHDGIPSSESSSEVIEMEIITPPVTTNEE